MEDLLSVLHPHCPVKVDALSKNRRRVEHGLTTVGLKIHCLGDNHERCRRWGGRNKGGVVSGVFNLESSGVSASDWRPRHDKHYHEA
jgi:hypothetical protein